MGETILVALLGFLGTCIGAYAANRKSTALIAYRLEQLEEKVNKHNQVIERTYKLETELEKIGEHLTHTDENYERLAKYHEP